MRTALILALLSGFAHAQAMHSAIRFTRSTSSATDACNSATAPCLRIHTDGSLHFSNTGASVADLQLSMPLTLTGTGTTAPTADGILLQNVTASDAVNQEHRAPKLTLTGTVFDATASQVAGWQIQQDDDFPNDPTYDSILSFFPIRNGARQSHPVLQLYQGASGAGVTITAQSITGTHPQIGLNDNGLVMAGDVDAAFTYDGTGNIVVPSGGGTATVNKVMVFVYDGSKWTPSY